MNKILAIGIIISSLWNTSSCWGTLDPSEEHLTDAMMTAISEFRSPDQEVSNRARAVILNMPTQASIELLDALRGNGAFSQAAQQLPSDFQDVMHKIALIILRDLDPTKYEEEMLKDLPAAILNNFHVFVENLSELSSATLVRRGALTYYDKGLPHGMYQYAIAETVPEKEDLQAMMRWFKDTPFYFCTGFEETKDSLALLEEAGLKSCGGLVGMYYDVKQEMPDADTTVKCDIESIVGPDDYQTFATVMTNAAEIDPSLGTRFFNDYEVYRTGQFLGLIAYVNDEAVGCTLLMQSEKPIAGNYFLWVLPKYRKQGIASALTVRCIEIAQRMGYEYLVVQCMTTSVNLHTRLGFKPVSKLGLYGK